MSNILYRQFELMQFRVLILIITLGLLLQPAVSYGSQISLSTATTASITNFYQNFAYCACDLSPSLCDNYCCCDTTCSTTKIDAWKAASSCTSSSKTLEDFCNETSNKGFGFFSDLACVYQSNRGQIGYYYQYPQTSSINYPFASKFASITINTIAQQIQTAAAGVILGSPYSTANPYLEATSSTFFFAPQPGPGGACIANTLNISSSLTSRCTVTPSSANCGSLNTNYGGSICLKGDCSSSSASQTITAASLSGSTCNNVLTGLTISYTISSSQNYYTLSSATVTPSYSNIALGSTAITTVTLTVSAPTSTSGNPGYKLGKAITINSALSAITDPSTGNCYAASSATGTISVLFGQANTYRCTSSSPCSNSYYIDSLLTKTITIQKYAVDSTETITVGGTAAGLNGCKYESYSLEIVYSYDGWQLDPQYYIVGAKLVPAYSDSINDPSTKFLSISWIYVDPKTVNSPVSNSFYEYFSKLWTPLKQKFGLV